MEAETKMVTGGLKPIVWAYAQLAEGTIGQRSHALRGPITGKTQTSICGTGRPEGGAWVAAGLGQIPCSDCTARLETLDRVMKGS